MNWFAKPTQTRRLVLSLLLLGGLGAASILSARTLTHLQPSSNWETQCFPLGNGRLGAMPYGGVLSDRIQFNEITLWTGDANPGGGFTYGTDAVNTFGAYQNFGDVYVNVGQGVTLSNPSNHATSSGESIANTIDGSSGTKWCMEHKGINVVWQATLESPVAPPATVSLTSANDVPARDPNAWVLEASNDGAAWTVLHSQASMAFSARYQTQTVTLAAPPPGSTFRYYRITFSINTATTHFQVAEIALPGVTNLTVSHAGYRRELDLDTGVQRVSYAQGGTNYTREYFVSRPAEVAVFRYTADRAGAYSGSVRLVDAHGKVTTASGNRLSASGAFVSNGMRFESQVRVLHSGGTIEARDGRIYFSGCDGLTILLGARTDYVMDYAAGWRGADPGPVLASELDAASAVAPADLRSAAVAAHDAVMGRFDLEFGTSDAVVLAKPTDARLSLYQAGGTDPDLEETLVQYGRYLLFCASRADNLPANLQGLWNQSNAPAWASDYHTNINIQMNYWGAEAANLPECHRGFVNWIKANEAPGKVATKAAFGAATRGWTARTSMNTHGGHGWEWNLPAGAWFGVHMWEHYAFSGDEAYLRDVGYPAMKEFCLYWEDQLKSLTAGATNFYTAGGDYAALKGGLANVAEGTLVAPNGWSPEHGPREDGVAHDQQIVRELFNDTVRAAEVLGVDAEWRATLAGRQARLDGPRIGSWGQLQEWMLDRDSSTDTHRHTSHLFAVYPGSWIGRSTTPAWADAAAISLAARGTTGDSRRSWTWPWRAALWARLGRPDKCGEMVRGLLTYNTLPNLFANHPPFQLDGNYGIVGAACEMVVQSHEGFVDLLPALPPAWAEGSVRGIRARGGFTLDLTWSAGRLTSGHVTSAAGKPCRVRGACLLGILLDGAAVPVERGTDGSVSFATVAGRTYEIVPLADATGYSAWRFDNFGVAYLGATAADDADPDCDGVANLIEYGLGSIPSETASAARPSVTIHKEASGSPRRLQMRIPLNPDASGVTYLVEVSDDLRTWSGVPGVDTILVSQSPTELVVRDAKALGTAPRFMRLRVSR